MKLLKKGLLIVFLVLAVLLVTVFSLEKTVENKKYNLKLSDEISIEGVYSGVMRGRHPNGEGTFIAETEKGTVTYEGLWRKGVCEEKGKIKDMPYSIEYEGETLEGVYNGEVVEFKPSGKGSFDYEDDDKYFKYDGTWKKGKPGGKGNVQSNFYVVHFKDVDRVGEYDGQVYNLEAKGDATFTAVNSAGEKYTYTGEWDNGVYNGYGECKFHEGMTYTGNFEDGTFTPTPYQYFASVGTDKDAKYGISKNAKKFLEKYPDVFLNNSTEGYDVKYEENFSYKAFAKNQEEYGDKLIKVSLNVIQIFEYEQEGNKFTFILGMDYNGNIYSVRKYGYTKNIYEGSRITLTALPLSYFTYKNISGSSTWAIMCAGVKVD